MKTERVLFGGVSLYRVFCHSCGDMALVSKGLLRCCGAEARPSEGDAVLVKEGDPYAGLRRGFKPRKVRREKILAEQGWTCIYCSQPFGSTTYDNKRDQEVTLQVAWDHFVPWAYARSHSVDFVAACQICNGIKTSRVYESVEAARQDIQFRRMSRYRP